MSFYFAPIGTIHTPYENSAPYQPIEEDKGDFYIEIKPKYKGGLKDLEKFTYIYVLFLLDRSGGKLDLTVSPPSWAKGKRVGLFASRSPHRPNPIGLSIVKIKKIEENIIFTTGLDAFDGTPLLDIKPYIKDLDSKDDSNYGWITSVKDFKHLLLHIKGIPH